MTDKAAGSLHDLVARSQARIKELRRAGDLVALVTAAKAAADKIVRRVGEGRSEEERQALMTVRRFTFNAAADCWPGWSVSDTPPDTRSVQGGQELAQRSDHLTKKLGLDPVHEGTGVWLCGAFELALGRYAEASSAFTEARQRYIEGKAPGLVLLTEGYIAILRQAAGQQVPVGGDDLDQVIDKIGKGEFEDGAEWIEQLRTAEKVFVGAG